jgi:DNA-directed RNA polymerase specialized sigma24 family protein
MLDVIPPPYGEVTRRWSLLAPEVQDRHSHRLLGVPLEDVCIERPVSLDQQRHYRSLVDAALDGDAVAFAWLAYSHAPLLVARGRPLFDADPVEWGEAALEVLHQGLHRAAAAEGPWARRRVALHLCSRMSRAVQRHMVHAKHVQPVDPVQLEWRAESFIDPHRDPHPDLTIALDQALAELEPSVADGLRAVSSLVPLGEVADAHAIDEVLLRQRMSRARRQLRPQLAEFSRSA